MYCPPSLPASQPNAALAYSRIAGSDGSEHALRFDKRNASHCLLALGVAAEQAAEALAVGLETLRRFAYCSHAWLLGRAEQPGEGYSPEEVAARVPQLAAGEEERDEGEPEWEEAGQQAAALGDAA